MLQLYKLAPSLLRQQILGTAPVRQFAAGPPQQPAQDEEETFELLPPGCSLKDPTYGRNRRVRFLIAQSWTRVTLRDPARAPVCHPSAALAALARRRCWLRCLTASSACLPSAACSLSDPVLIYDSKPVEEYRPLKNRKPAPQPPLNVQVQWGSWAHFHSRQGIRGSALPAVQLLIVYRLAASNCHT